MTMSQWKGVFPAVTTKMTPEGTIDAAAMQSSLDRLVRNGVSGVIVLPMLGENASLSVPEREMVIRLAREAVGGRVPVLSGLAEITLDTAKANAAAYKSFGAEGGFPEPGLQDGSARDGPLVSGDCARRLAYHGLQQPDRLRGGCHRGHPRRADRRT
jgi:4-hydroxy-tetrahydrodipicolinate synthase